MTEPALPIPEITSAMEPFWAAARERRLVVQRCSGCGRLRFPARPVCSGCLATDAEWVPVAGTGTVFSKVIMHRATHPAFAARVPYAVVTVELDEGVRILSGMVDIDPHDIAIGMPVEVVFEPRGEEVLLPLFRRRVS